MVSLGTPTIYHLFACACEGLSRLCCPALGSVPTSPPRAGPGLRRPARTSPRRRLREATRFPRRRRCPPVMPGMSDSRLACDSPVPKGYSLAYETVRDDCALRLFVPDRKPPAHYRGMCTRMVSAHLTSLWAW